MKTPLLRIFDLLAVVFVIPSAYLMKLVRMIGVQRLPIIKSILLRVGVFPIHDQYYEPQFNYSDESNNYPRKLPGVNLDLERQLSLLNSLVWYGEFQDFVSSEKSRGLDGSGRRFHIANTSFEAGDAEIWFQLIRKFKPSKIIEIGSGNSTLVAHEALRINNKEGHRCEHLCIEPFEMLWLEQLGIEIRRKKVEEFDVDFFSCLERNDILFIDSSHIIRPHGDVLFEFLEILPTLKPGVIVHIHDIFTPYNYPSSWYKDQVIFWNEQYILESFLTSNSDWEVLCANNYLSKNAYNELKRAATFLSPESSPGSFYIRRL